MSHWLVAGHKLDALTVHRPGKSGRSSGYLGHRKWAVTAWAKASEICPSTPLKVGQDTHILIIDKGPARSILT